MAYTDSWLPMVKALRQVRRAPEEDLYQAVFYEGATKFQYPPSSLLVFEALHRVPGGLLRAEVLNRVSHAAVALTALLVAWLLLRGVRDQVGALAARDSAALALLAVAMTLSFYPVARSYYLGQLQTWINPLLVATLLAYGAGRRASAGALTALICALKPALAFLVVWALLRRQWRFVAGFAGVGAGVTVASLWAYGLQNHLAYLDVLSYIASRGESFYPNQSVNGLLHRLLMNGPNLAFDDRAFAPFHPLVYAGTQLSSLLLIGFALLWRRREHDGGTLDFGVALWTFTLAAPVVWEHHYGAALPLFAMALPALLAVTREPPAAAWRKRGLIALGLAYVFISNHFAVANRLADTGWNFLQSTAFFAGLGLLALLYRLRRESCETTA